MKVPWSLVPLLPVCAAFIGGIVLNNIVSEAAVAIIPLAVALVFLFTRNVYPFALTLVFLSGYIDAHINEPQPLPPSLENRNMLFSGVIEKRKETNSGISLTLKIDSVENQRCRKFGMIVSLPGENPELSEQNRIRLRTSAKSPTFDPDLPDEINYAANMKRRGIVAVAFSPADSLKLNIPENTIFAKIARCKSVLINSLKGAHLNAPTTDFLITTLSGDSSAIDMDTREMFAASGLAHVLALSGLHVGIIAWLASLLLWPVYATGHRNIRFIAVLSIIWLYAIMTGLSPSVTRAVIMATVFTVGLITGRRKSPLNSLCFSVIVILALWPETLLSPGFQMSVAAVASIVLFNEKLNPFKRRAHPRLHYFAQIFTVSLSAMLGTAILSAFYFHVFPLYFLITAVASTLLVPVLLAGGILVAFMAYFEITLPLLSDVLNMSYDLLTDVSRFFAGLPGNTFDKLYIDPLTVVCYFGALVFIYLALRTRRIMIWGCIALAWIATGFVVSEITTPIYPDEIYFSRKHNSTSILVKNSNTLWVITSAANSADRSDLISEMTSSYRDFMNRRGVDSIKIAPDSFATPLLTRSGNKLTVRGRRYAMIFDRDDTTKNIDAAIVCRGYRGNIIELVRKSGAREILLGNCLNRRRHDRYFRELKESGIPVRSLRESYEFNQ